jgi:RNA polymerase sigma-70 factor (ECF subfamily)
MKVDAAAPFAADDPVAAALNDPEVRSRLGSAARAFLGPRGAELTATQRTAQAEAIVQEAAARAWTRRDQFDASRDIVRWLVGFVVNVAREFAKRRGRETTGPPPDGAGLETIAVDPARAVDEAVADRLLAAHLLERLPDLDRQIVQMKYWREMTCAEIGEQVGMNENAVRVRLFRALLNLKRLCDATGEGQP